MMSANQKIQFLLRKVFIFLIMCVAFCLILLFHPYVLQRDKGISKAIMKQPYGKMFL